MRKSIKISEGNYRKLEALKDQLHFNTLSETLTYILSSVTYTATLHLPRTAPKPIPTLDNGQPDYLIAMPLMLTLYNKGMTSPSKLQKALNIPMSDVLELLQDIKDGVTYEA